MTALALAEDANVTHTETLLATARTLREKAEALREIADGLVQTAATVEANAVGSHVQWIRGREIIQRLAELVDVDDELHYRDMVDQLTLAGYRPAGVDATATLLAAVHRSEEFTASPPGSGVYRRVR